MSSAASPRAPRGERAAFLGAIALIFAPIGLLIGLVQEEAWGWGFAVIVALFSVVIAVGWAHAVESRRWWLLVPVNLLPFAAGDWIFAPLADLGLASVGAQYSETTRRLILAGASAACVTLGFIVIVRVIQAGERRVGALRVEMALAGKIHARLVPAIDRPGPGCTIEGRSAPSASMGGDLIDVVEAGGATDVLIADVAGHGVAAGLVMGVVKGAMRSARAGDGPAIGPADLLARLSAVVSDLDTPTLFVTAALVRLEPRPGDAGGVRARVALAGHPDVLIARARAGGLERVENTALPLGVAPVDPTMFTDHPVELEAGDVLVAYTDGLADVFAPGGRRLGFEGVRELVRRLAPGGAAGLAAGLIEEAARFGAIVDDCSAVAVRAVGPDGARP